MRIFDIHPEHALPGLALAALLTGCAGNPAPDPVEPAASAAAASAVTSEEIERTPSVPIEQLLLARVPGLRVLQTPGGGMTLRIRGGSSMAGSNEPLFVVDGVPVQPGPTGSLANLRLHDIESVEVLKDAVSTSMYGVRGANGVIVITTKRPKR